METPSIYMFIVSYCDSFVSKRTYVFFSINRYRLILVLSGCMADSTTQFLKRYKLQVLAVIKRDNVRQSQGYFFFEMFAPKF